MHCRVAELGDGPNGPSPRKNSGLPKYFSNNELKTIKNKKIIEKE